MAHGKGTSHHKLHGYVGWGVIIGLPFVIFSVIHAIKTRSQGFVDWLSSPIGDIGFLAFFGAAVWYCKLEFDEVVMDYFDGGLRSFALLANSIVSVIIFLIAAYAALSLAFG